MKKDSSTPDHKPNATLYFTLQGIGWALYGTLNAFAFSEFKFPTWGIFLGNLAVAGVGFALSHLLRTFLQPALQNNAPRRNWITRIAIGVPVCALVLALFTVLLNQLIYSGATTHSLSRVVVAVGINYLFVFSLWVACYLGVKFAARWRHSELSRLRALAAARHTELTRLRAQFEPHLLFNTLNTISALIAENPELAREAIRHLSALLRASLTLDAHALVPLSTEWALVGDYLRLEELRFPNRLAIRHEISPRALTCRLPAFALQTLVENAVKHGANETGNPREIILSAEVEGDQLCIAVRNPGEIIAAKLTPTGVGLKNIRERLKLLCGPDAMCSLEQESAGRVLAQLQIPQ